MPVPNYVIGCLAMLLLCTSGQVSAEEAKGKTVRFYTGNLSVGFFMEYWGTGKEMPGDVPTPEFCQQMKGVGVSAVCDYISWCLAEKEPGRWDWSIYDRNERILHENGLQYNVFCWIHHPPKWFLETSDFVPYRCLEHNESVLQTSVWAPGTLRAFDRFYKQLAEHFGDKIDFLRLSAPSDYGEIGYPAGMTNWLRKQEHVHAGFWCNDPCARANFKEVMTKRYRTIASLNKAWGTQYKSFDQIEFPEMAKDRSKLKKPLEMTPAERRQMLDFIGWYYDSQAEFMRKAVGIVRKYFPGKEIIVSMGYASQNPVYGNDDVGVSKMCRDLKIACQTPGNVPYFAMKSLASPCNFYGVPYFTEPPGGMNRNEEVSRIFSDVSCGCQTYFDYPANLVGAKDLFERYRQYLKGQKAIVDMAVFFPTVDHRLRIQDWPQSTMVGCNTLRECLDFDLADERMIRDGALEKYRILLKYDGNIIQAATTPAFEKWLSNGGILLARDVGLIETVDGDRSFYERVFPKLTPLGDKKPDQITMQDLMATNCRRIGKGAIILVPAEVSAEGQFAGLAADLAHNLSKYFPGKQDVPLIDNGIDGVSATLFTDKILMFTWQDKPVEVNLRLRESDFPAGGRTGRPEKFEQALKLEPHSIAHIELK
jgi:hypothetical protein